MRPEWIDFEGIAGMGKETMESMGGAYMMGAEWIDSIR